MEETAVKETLPKEVAKMTAFIQQEAEEKARELKIRADEEYAVEKARLVRIDSGQVEAMLVKKLRDSETKRKVAESSQANKEQLKVLIERDQLLTDVFEETRAKLSSISNNQQKYIQLLSELIEETISRMSGEKELILECRPKDKDSVESICKQKSTPKLSLSADPVLNDSSAGGICARSRSGKIRCDNTLESRLALAIEGLLPAIRIQAFGASENRKFTD